MPHHGKAAQPAVIVGIGEVLWDLFPTGRLLGGAPANFAWHAATLGAQGIVASRVGADELGDEIIERLDKQSLSTEYIQIDEAHPTGSVVVQLDAQGRPEFTITENVAWDYMAWTPQWQTLAAKADAVCFGSLAQRGPETEHTIQCFLHAMRPEALKVFDVNLRPPFYSPAPLAESLRTADVVKLNSEELDVLRDLLELDGETTVDVCRKLISIYQVRMVCVTRGADGSLLVTSDAVSEHRGVKVQVADTVGAGDAFTAALVYHYLAGSSLDRMSEAANLLGAWVASQPGATPEPDPEVIREVVG